MRMAKLEPDAVCAFVETQWSEAILPTLTEYIRIPNKSPMFDANWQANGHIDRVAKLFLAWCEQNPIAGMTARLIQSEGRTPLLYVEIPGVSPNTVLLYGHMDKQPEMTGWSDGLGPWTPVLKDGRLYGRGGADDGYALFATMTALAALSQQKIPHARCVILIEACEESGSYDLPYYMADLRDSIGDPELVVCLDSGCGNYEQLWCTTSLRGIVTGTLTVDVVTEGIHSGDASGIVASSFRIARQLLSRLEDEFTGEIKAQCCWSEIPASRIEQARSVAAVLGSEVYDKFPLCNGVRPITMDPAELILNRTWRPALSITGASGLPSVADGGNVLRPQTGLKLSLRLPPRVEAAPVVAYLRNLFETDAPYGAQVRFSCGEGATGWEAPPVAAWLDDSLQRASQQYFGRPAMYMGEGGSIPFMGMLGERFPNAQFVITGVLGPHSNAHGPNEFLELATAKKITCCIASLLADHQSMK